MGKWRMLDTNPWPSDFNSFSWVIPTLPRFHIYLFSQRCLFVADTPWDLYWLQHVCPSSALVSYIQWSRVPWLGFQSCTSTTVTFWDHRGLLLPCMKLQCKLQLGTSAATYRKRSCSNFFTVASNFGFASGKKLFIWKKIGAATKLKRDKIPRSSHKKYHRKEASGSCEVQNTGRDQNLKPSLQLSQQES